MEPVNPSLPTRYNQLTPARKAECPTYNAASVQLYSPQQSTTLATYLKAQAQRPPEKSLTDFFDSALAKRQPESIATPAINISNNKQQPGPQYDRKETASGVVWERNNSVIIEGVNLKEWPGQLTPREVKEHFESGRARFLYTVPDNPNHRANQQESPMNTGLTTLQSTEKAADTQLPTPNLQLLLPESDAKAAWLAHFYSHPEQVVENAVAQAFGVEGERFITSRLYQFKTSNERARQWREVCALLRSNRTCAFPYTPGEKSPSQGKGENIILDMLLTQKDKPTDAKADAMRKKMSDFLTKEGIQGELAFNQRPSRVPQYRGGFMAQNQTVSPGTVQFFLTTTQVRQLFQALRSFATHQTPDS